MEHLAEGACEFLFEQIEEAKALGHKVKPVISGPLTWLWLGKGNAYERRDLPVADVIMIETSRSNMLLLDAVESFEYPTHIGPGVYGIHSPNVPDKDWMVRLIGEAAKTLGVAV